MSYKPRGSSQVIAYLMPAEVALLDRHATVERMSRAQVIARVLMRYLRESQAELEQMEKETGNTA